MSDFACSKPVFEVKSVLQNTSAARLDRFALKKRYREHKELVCADRARSCRPVNCLWFSPRICNVCGVLHSAPVCVEVISRRWQVSAPWQCRRHLCSSVVRCRLVEVEERTFNGRIVCLSVRFNLGEVGNSGASTDDGQSVALAISPRAFRDCCLHSTTSASRVAIYGWLKCYVQR